MCICLSSVHCINLDMMRVDSPGLLMSYTIQKENLLLEAEDTLISVGGLGISPRQALTVFGIKKD